MVNSKEDKFVGGGGVGDNEIDGSDLVNQVNDVEEDELEVEVASMDSSTSVSSSSSSSSSRLVVNRRSGTNEGSFTERLRDILSGEGGDEDLANDRGNNFVQWLQALDIQLLGACRADERMKPLFKLNVSSGVAEDRLLAQLSQHFDAAEVGILARCLFMPLVSIRVGKVIKQGSLLCPTAERGNLNLTLLPNSDLRISFVGDDGSTERLATLSGVSKSSMVEIKEIQADSSGRSFLVQVLGGQDSYFWCSEKSKAFGHQLLAKLKDLLGKKPSLSKLTGISESRLDCFAVHLHEYLLGSLTGAKTSTSDETISLLGSAFDESSEFHSSTLVSSLSSKPFRSQQNNSNVAAANSLNQGTSNRLVPLLENQLMENLRLHGDSSCNLSGIDDLPLLSTSTINELPTRQTDNIPTESGTLAPLSSVSLESLGAFTPLNASSQNLPSFQVPTPGSTLFSSYNNCWYPLSAPTLQYTVTAPHLPMTLPESLSLPPLISAVRSSSSPPIQPMPSLNLANFPSLDFTDFKTDPMVHVHLSGSSFIAGPSSQQIPAFTPLFCDSIVHIPVLDVCSSSGQGYLVSAGPAISTTIIPPLHQNIVNPLMPQTESSAEKGARETLQLLLASTQMVNSPQLMMQQVLTLTEEKPCSNSISFAASHGLYSGNRDVNAIIANSIATIPMMSLPNGVSGAGLFTKNSHDDGSNESEVQSGFGGRSYFLDDGDDARGCS
ncbi:uncharacterized protein LOC113309914 isoform X2 [Papaver somniferum]|uniref:uncharacterized protein LOC113309914 isoform X2 n=1 Tax=Papaver somniferum TaxID=3469 RepID=UPI000E6FB418|nr:uncharacterized protein LOC113309914 isoform X2 [Papaver somniferum]